MSLISLINGRPQLFKHLNQLVPSKLPFYHVLVFECAAPEIYPGEIDKLHFLLILKNEVFEVGLEHKLILLLSLQILGVKKLVLAAHTRVHGLLTSENILDIGVSVEDAH